MLKTLALSLLLFTAALPSLASATTGCTSFGVCPYLVVEPPARTCVGAAFGLQGVAVCETQSIEGTCVVLVYGFNRVPACSTLDVQLP